jgi:hypothetical protein
MTPDSLQVRNIPGDYNPDQLSAYLEEIGIAVRAVSMPFYDGTRKDLRPGVTRYAVVDTASHEDQQRALGLKDVGLLSSSLLSCSGPVAGEVLSTDTDTDLDLIPRVGCGFDSNSLHSSSTPVEENSYLPTSPTPHLQKSSSSTIKAAS